jgi:hypothetical protein
MTLVANAAAPGRWINDAWQPGTPGLFAVVVGVSDYPHLADGQTAAPETYDLGQLSVSALTAWRVFEWLRDRYRVAGCPLARVWLLLAPKPAELAIEPAMAGHAKLPTIAHCEEALQQWQAEMQALPQTAAEGSRSFFFFSGHGIEVHVRRQILLPSDYLRPPGRNVNDAVSVENLLIGLSSLSVPRQFFFLDACRNDNQKLREKRIEGRQILNEDVAAHANERVVAPVLYATASGRQAFQQPDPSKGLSIFGTALLEGLNGAPEIELRSVGPDESVNVFPLQTYVKARVVDLLEEAQERVRQSVKLDGDHNDDIVTLISPRAVAHADVPAAATPMLRAAQVAQRLDAPFGVQHVVPDPYQPGAWAMSYQVGHAAFGSEWATALWSEASLIALSSRQVHDSAALVLHGVERDADTRRFRVHVTPKAPDPLGHWLELRQGERRFGAVLPSDRGRPVRYIVEFDLEYRDPPAVDDRRVSRFEADLAADPHSPAGIAAGLWRIYNVSNAATAAQWLQDQQLAERLLYEKFESPLAASIASLVLLRANRFDLMHDWVRNLANWYPEIPDGAVLWAEQVLRRSRTPDALREAARYLLMLDERGLPLLAETLGVASRQLALLQTRFDVLDAPTLTGLKRLNERFAEALVYFRPDGLFSVFSGYGDRDRILQLLGLGAFRSAPLTG